MPSSKIVCHFEDLLSSELIEVPMLPDVASQVLSLSNDPDSDAAQLAKLIQGDQALAGHVMKVANSAAYTPNASMVSLQQAIARLGMSLITDIAIASSLNAKLFTAPAFKRRLAEIWSHALYTALWGKEVARISKNNVEASFLCGLLHSIGRPAILQVISEYSAQHEDNIEYDEALVLEEQFHVAFGEIIVKKWNMPIIVQESVQYYQHYDDAQKNKNQVMVINGAAKLASVKGDVESIGESENITDLTIDEVLKDTVFSDLNLYEDEIELLKQQQEKVKSGVEAMRV